MTSKMIIFNSLIYFIDLESEMYQLSHLLIEQRNILSTLREKNSVEDPKNVLMDETDDGLLK